MNSMTIINSTTMLKECTTFIFGSCICISNGHGGFNSHLANPREPEASVPISINDVDNLANNFGEI